MKLKELLSYTEALLAPENYNDYAPNGLQVEGDGREIKKICTAVSASLDAIEAAASQGADALFVHHGWFWKHDEVRITGIRYKRIHALLTSGMALVAYHLPLDNHLEIGNNALLGKALGVTPQGRFGEGDFGWYGALETSLTVDALKEKLQAALQRAPLVVGAQEKSIRTVAWCTGAAQDYIEEAARIGADAYISGEISERTTYIAKELGMTYFSCGHHATERFGIRALGEKIEEIFGIPSVFIDTNNPV